MPRGARFFLDRLFRRERLDREMDEEIRSHLELRATELQQVGLSPQEARRRARLEFGGTENYKEECRETRRFHLLHDFVADIRYGLRMLRKSPGFTLAAVLTLAIGIAASTVVFSAFYNLLFNAFAARDAGRLVVPVIRTNAEQADPLLVSLSDLDIIRRQNHSFEDVVGYAATGLVLVRDGTQTFQFRDARVTANAFEFYGVPPLLGRGLTRDDGRPAGARVFVLSYQAWRGTFNANPDVLGKSLIVDGEPRTLVGVMPARFQAYGAAQDLWLPIQSAAADQRLRLSLLARLKPGAKMAAATAEVDMIVKRLALLHPQELPPNFSVHLQSATDFLLRPEASGVAFNSDVRHLLYALLAAVGLLLLIACSNVANLLLARATARRQEIAVRSALGASRSRLVRQLLAEISVLAAAACVLGCALAWAGMKLITAVIPRTLGPSLGSRIGGETVIGLDILVVLFALIVTVLTVMICGIAPALHLRSADVQPHLAAIGKGGGVGFRHRKLRNSLVVGEMALSIVLLVGGGLVVRSFFVLTHVDLGFNPKNVLLLAFMPPRGHDQVPDRSKATSPQGQAVLRQVLERLRASPGVAEVTVQDTIPGYGPTRGPKVTVPGGLHAEEAGLLSCDESFLRVLELDLLQGRWLTRDEVQTAQQSVVINQKLAHDFFGDSSPLNRQIRVKDFQALAQPPRDRDFQIVGVVADIKSIGPQQPAIPMLFVPVTLRGGSILLLRTRVEPASLLRAVQREVWAVDGDQVFWVSGSLDDFLQRFTYATPEFAAIMSAPLAGIALLLVIVGVVSVMAYTVSLKTRDISIRMALGAQPGDISRTVLRSASKMIGIGIFIGLSASFLLTRFLRSQIWGISPTDPATFAAVLMLIAVVGLIAGLVPARRAAKVDPMVALRYE